MANFQNKPNFVLRLAYCVVRVLQNKADFVSRRSYLVYRVLQNKANLGKGRSQNPAYWSRNEENTCSAAGLECEKQTQFARLLREIRNAKR